MLVELWNVGNTTKDLIPLTPAKISLHLLADWVPSFPESLAKAVMGWPEFLLETTPVDGVAMLALHERVGRTERQWKGFLSWMLGCAGTRHVLELERYRWIAPLSAFYRKHTRPVDIAGWPFSYPPTSIVVDPRPKSHTRLRPDYLAVRSTAPRAGESIEWAIVEAKGTKARLETMVDCPEAWAEQARNAIVSVDGAIITVPRHLVVATRVNPNAHRSSTRRLQLRAWNRSLVTERSRTPPEVAVEVAAATLYGLLRSLNLRQTSYALAAAAQARHEARVGEPSGATRELVSHLIQESEAELAYVRTRAARDALDVIFEIDTSSGRLEVELAQPLIRLVTSLQKSLQPPAAFQALQAVDLELDSWEAARPSTDYPPRTAWLPLGVEVRPARRAI